MKLGRARGDFPVLRVSLWHGSTFLRADARDAPDDCADRRDNTPARETTPAGGDTWCVRGSTADERRRGREPLGTMEGQRDRPESQRRPRRDTSGRGGHMQGSQASTYHKRRVALRQLEPSIPARYYYDPQHYERELEVFWYGMWVMAGREEEIPAPRDYKVVKIGTQSIVIVRDLEGRLQAFHNTCRHRGSILCTEEQGR